MKEGYNVFLMIELAKAKGIIPKELEYNLMWERGCALLTEFENTFFDIPNKGLYECITDFLNDEYKAEAKLELETPKLTKKTILKFLMENTHIEGRYIGGGDEPNIIVFSDSDGQDKESFLSQKIDEMLK